MTDLAKLVVKLEAQTLQYVQQLDMANKKLEKFTKSQDVTLSGVAKKFATLGIAAATGIGLLVKHAIDGADHLNDLAKISGVSTESLSKLEFAAKQSGGTLEDVATGLKKLNLAMSEAAGNAKSDSALAFKSLGISVTDAAGRMKTADDVFKELATKFAGFSDGANKSALANQFFGKSFQALIPLLNEGGSGIDELGKQAEKFGLVISGDMARAADEFNDRLGAMKAQLVDGLANQIMADVLPAFIELQKVWAEDSGRAEALASLASGLSSILKGLVIAGVAVASVFQQVGTAIGAAYASQTLFLKGDFKGAFNVLSSAMHDVTSNVTKDIEKIEKVWNAGPLNPKNMDASAKAFYALSKGHGSIKGPMIEAPNFDALKEAQAAAEKATKDASDKHAAALKKQAEAAENARQKLGDMNKTLSEEVATFGMGEAAATEYRLTVGTMADDVEKAGKSGEKLRDQIIAQSNALEALNSQKAVLEIDQQIQELTGHTTEAAIAAFDLSNELLKASLIRTNNEDGLARLEQLKKLTVAQAAYNEEEQKRQDILDDLQIVEDRIQHSQEVGAVNELTALEELDTARKAAADQLQVIADKQEQIAKNSGSTELIRNAEASAAAIDKLREQTDLLGQKIKSTFEDIGSDALASFLDGTKSAADAAKSFIHDLEKTIADFVAKDLMRRLLGDSLSGTKSGSGGLFGAAASFLGSIFGGGRDSGGMGQPGKAYAIGTGAQPELFIPSSHGNFVPATAMGGGGMQVVQHFHFDSPTDRRTQAQIGAKAAGGVANAQRRNG